MMVALTATFVLAIAAVCSADLLLVAHNVTVATENTAILNCSLAGYSGAGAVSITIRKEVGLHSDTSRTEVDSTTILVSLASAKYSDNGRYICSATVRDSNSSEAQNFSTSFYVQIQGYEAPRKQSVGLFGLVQSSEQSLVSCPVVGVPGPITFYWERGEDLFNTTSYKRITMANNVSSGPFVNEQGQLDLSRSTEEDSMFYLCTGVDVAGASASQLFRVQVDIQEAFVLWIQWYMILTYCVVGAVIIVVVLLLVWYIAANRHDCCLRETKRVTVKKRVKRETMMSQTKSPTEEEIRIDNLLFDMYRTAGQK